MLLHNNPSDNFRKQNNGLFGLICLKTMGPTGKNESCRFEEKNYIKDMYDLILFNLYPPFLIRKRMDGSWMDVGLVDGWMDG